MEKFSLLFNKRLLILGSAILIFITRVKGVDNVLVKTDSGYVRGLTITSKISNFYAFLSIPYAKSPIGDLRFQPPMPIEPWNEVHDGRVDSLPCPQDTSEPVSEDCLKLSIYTKKIENASMPVYIYVHEGGLESGSAKFQMYGPHYFMQHDIVVITLQFRLGMLGFLNLRLEEAPGNMGLLDVIEALKWIKNNIKYFGGDPNTITLGGVSSGGIMTHALMLSPRSTGLFHKVIIQSGTALSYRFYHENPSPAISKLKQTIKMTNYSNDEVLRHLKTRSVEDIVQITRSIKNRYHEGYAQYYPFVITKDFSSNAAGPILRKNPLELIRDNNYEHLPMIIGYTSDEGIRLEPYINNLDFVNDNFHIVVPTDLFDIDDMSEQKLETARTIKQFYFGNEDLSSETFKQYADLCRDSWHAHITDYPVRIQAHLNYTQSIFYYIFAVDGAYNYQKIKNGYNSPGASHADDIGYMWETDLFSGVYAKDDFSDTVRERMVKMWSNFIKYGNPTPETDNLLPIIWKGIDHHKINYLLFNNTLRVKENPLRENLLFWQTLYGFECL